MSVVATVVVLAMSTLACRNSGTGGNAAGRRPNAFDLVRDLQSPALTARLEAAKKMKRLAPFEFEPYLPQLRAAVKKEADQDVKAAIQEVLAAVERTTRR